MIDLAYFIYPLYKMHQYLKNIKDRILNDLSIKIYDYYKNNLIGKKRNENLTSEYVELVQTYKLIQHSSTFLFDLEDVPKLLFNLFLPNVIAVVLNVMIIKP